MCQWIEGQVLIMQQCSLFLFNSNDHSNFTCTMRYSWNLSFNILRYRSFLKANEKFEGRGESLVSSDFLPYIKSRPCIGLHSHCPVWGWQTPEEPLALQWQAARKICGWEMYSNSLPEFIKQWTQLPKFWTECFLIAKCSVRHCIWSLQQLCKL